MKIGHLYKDYAANEYFVPSNSKTNTGDFIIAYALRFKGDEWYYTPANDDPDVWRNDQIVSYSEITSASKQNLIGKILS